MSPEMGLKCFGTFEKQDQSRKSRHQSWCEPVSIDRNRYYCIVFFSKYSFQWLLLERGYVAWDLFVESPETFRAHFGCHNSLCIFKTKANWGTKLCSYFYFYSLYDIWEDQLYRISRPEFYEWLFGPEKLSGLSGNGPLVLRAPYLCVWLIEFFFLVVFFFFFGFFVVGFHFREHVELYQSGCVIKEFFLPDRMLVVMWRWRGNLIRSLTFLSSVMRSIKGELVLFQSVVDVYLFV